MVALLQGHLFTNLFVNKTINMHAHFYLWILTTISSNMSFPYMPMSCTSKEVDRRDLTNIRVEAVVKLCMKNQQPTI